MGLLGRRGSGDDEPVAPTFGPSRRPPKEWARVRVTDDLLVIRLGGWRAVWATTRTLRIPIGAVVAVAHDPAAHQRVNTRLRKTRGSRTALFKLGAHHGRVGWSFWACGLARNAVVIETSGVRYRFVVVEVANPKDVVKAVREGAGIAPPAPARAPTVRPITAARRLRRDAGEAAGGRSGSSGGGSGRRTSGPVPSPARPRPASGSAKRSAGSSPATEPGRTATGSDAGKGDVGKGDVGKGDAGKGDVGADDGGTGG
jgi:hypothetical protein